VPAAIDDQLPQLGLGGAPLAGGSIMNPAAFNPDLLPGSANTSAAHQQQMMLMMMQMQQAMMMQMANNGTGGGSGPGIGGMGMGQDGRGLAGRMGGYAGGAQQGGGGAAGRIAREPLPPTPAGGEDPRARKGRVSYMDLDEMGGGGDGGLPY
jgi:hypothetical protein